MPEMEKSILDSLNGQLSTKMVKPTYNAIYEMAKKLEEKNIVSSDDVNVVSYLEKIIQTALDDSLRETDKETHQAMEAFVHNLNTMHSRCGAQVEMPSIRETLYGARVISVETYMYHKSMIRVS
jgi:DNA-binding protein YbaB